MVFARWDGLLSVKAYCASVRLPSQEFHVSPERTESPQLKAAPQLSRVCECQVLHRLHQALAQAKQQLQPTAQALPAGQSSGAVAPHALLRLMHKDGPFGHSNYRTVKPDHQCVFASQQPLSLQQLVDIAYSVLFHSRHGRCDRLHELGRNRQAHIMASSHVPETADPDVFLAHPPPAPNAQNLISFRVTRADAYAFITSPQASSIFSTDHEYHKRLT